MKNIKLIFLDVDGTLTDGKIYIDNNGVESKSFNVKDGMAIAQAINLGIEIVIITGRYSLIVDIRAKELGIIDIFQGIKNKEKIVEEILNQKGITYSEVAYVGDDINDLKVMEKVKYSFSPKDAVKEVQKISTFVSKFKGGEGAVREIIELIFNEKNEWNEVLKNYRGISQ